jgi:putative ABC transport system ATP-binding protein
VSIGRTKGTADSLAARPRQRVVQSSGAAGAVVSCSDLRRRFGEGAAAVDALAGVSLEFPKDELTAIVGPSGSGKSTLLHILAGLDRPTSGSVWIDGVEITALDDRALTDLRRDKLGFVFQFFNLVPVLTAEENLVLPLKIAGGQPDRERVDRLLETVDMIDRRSHRPSELSGGQQQRVSVARALVTQPAVVFADEPTGNLDSKSGTEVLGLLRQAVDEFEQTVVMVTHDPRIASYADRVIVLADGVVTHDGRVQSADEVLALMQVD